MLQIERGGVRPYIDLHDVAMVEEIWFIILCLDGQPTLRCDRHREQRLAGGLPLHGRGLPKAFLEVHAYAAHDGEVSRVPFVRVGVFGCVDVRGGLAVVVEVEPCEGVGAVVAPFFLALFEEQR